MTGLFLPQPRVGAGAGGISGSARYDTALYPQAYGAVGDGVEDDTAALQAWLTATATLGRRGHAPAGTYLVSAELSVPDGGGDITGDGIEATFFQWAGANDDGDAMIVWSRKRGRLSGLTLECLATSGNRATHGLVLQNGYQSHLNFRVLRSARHGIVVHSTWGERAAGTSHNTVFDHCIVEQAGAYATVSVDTNATGGTFTLEITDHWSNTYTTAPIAWNASAATIAAAMQAANPIAYNVVESWLSRAQGDAFYAAGSAGGYEVVNVWGVLAGHPITVTADSTGLAGGPADVVVTTPKRGNGFHMDTNSGIDNNAIGLLECSIGGNVGHGAQIFAAGIRVWGGLYEGNRDAGLHFSDETAFTITNNLILWPWLEGNSSGGVTDEGTGSVNYNLVVNGPGLQGVAETAGTTHVVPQDASLLVTQNIGVTPRYTRIAPDQLAGTSGAQIGLSGTYAKNPEIQNANGVVVMSVVDTDDVILGLTGNVTSLTLSDPVSTQIITLSMFHNGGPFTVAFAQTVLWAGGAAPALGSGGANSWDVLTLRWHFGSWHEVSRSLGVK